MRLSSSWLEMARARISCSERSAKRFTSGPVCVAPLIGKAAGRTQQIGMTLNKMLRQKTTAPPGKGAPSLEPRQVGARENCLGRAEDSYGGWIEKGPAVKTTMHFMEISVG